MNVLIVLVLEEALFSDLQVLEILLNKDVRWSNIVSSHDRRLAGYL